MEKVFELADLRVVHAIQWLRLAIELTGAIVIAIGFAIAISQLVMLHLRGLLQSFTEVRLTFGRYLSLALEFQLASDILSTAVAPTWEELGKLGATAVIRTALNYFLSREVREYSEKVAETHSELARPGKVERIDP